MTSISVIVPVYSGEKYLKKLVEEVQSLRYAWESNEAPINLVELILVDDAAIDESPRLADSLANEHMWVTTIRLSRNFGQHAATIAGILHSSGDWVVTLDEDLQHPPSRIEEMLSRAVRHNDDVVYARPEKKAVHAKAWRDDSSRIFKRLMEWLTGTPSLRLVNSFRLMRGSIARATASVCTHNTYFDIALTWFTQSISAFEMPMHDERFSSTGKSGYSLSKLIGHAQKMLFSSQLRFLSIGLWMGFILFILSIIAGIYFLIVRIISPDAIGVQGWTSLFVAVCASAGLISAMLGICMQYLSTLVLKAHGRPTFFVIDRSSDGAILEWLENQHSESRERIPKAKESRFFA
jgi:glycosyltransferase involved in cell wall biosynthesis